MSSSRIRQCRGFWLAYQSSNTTFWCYVMRQDMFDIFDMCDWHRIWADMKRQNLVGRQNHCHRGGIAFQWTNLYISCRWFNGQRLCIQGGAIHFARLGARERSTGWTLLELKMLIGDRSLSKVIYLPKNLQCQHMVCIIKKCETLIRPGAKAAEGRGSVGQRGNRDPTLPTASASIFSITASASIHIFNSSLNYLWVATHLHWWKYLMLSSDCEVHGPLLRKADQERRNSLQSRGAKTPSVNPLLRDSHVWKK